MNRIPRLSEAVYTCLCVEVGLPTEVQIRREIDDIEEMLQKATSFFGNLDRMKSGSNREGFRFKSSDIDNMAWFLDHKLICDLSQINLYRTPQHTVILMEWEDLPPGFTKLKMMTPSFNLAIKEACITIDEETYISSTRMRSTVKVCVNIRTGAKLLSEPHGPCASVKFRGKEHDIALCFRSHHWPNVALPWIQRCRLKQWPPESVLSAILKEGCHAVAISSVPSDREKEIEWRISFSGSEQKLVCSMNHCQFLCYGLLKIFLKEVINAEVNNPCLCSYFMKTIMFWVIQSNSSRQWCPSELLQFFWTCFKLLLSWVYKGECPNFFIPENNMFRVKVTGQTQVLLFNQLYELYCKGISCLLLSPTIRTYLELILMHRSLEVTIFEPDAVADACLFAHMRLGSVIRFRNENTFIALLTLMEHLLKTRITLFQSAAIERNLFRLIRNFSWFMLNKPQAMSSNQERALIYNRAINLMKLASRMSCSSEILYLALFYYRVCAYEKSLKCLLIAQNKLSKPYAMYSGSYNQMVYSRRTTGLSLSDKMRKALVDHIDLLNNCTYIDELKLEQTLNSSDSLSIPPFVMLNMLFVLNHQALGDTIKSQQFLQNLHTLLLYDSDILVPQELRDISWQILGICQQVCGDYVGALDSFRRSLQETPSNDIQKATLSRIQTLNDMLVIYG